MWRYFESKLIFIHQFAEFHPNKKNNTDRTISAKEYDNRNNDDPFDFIIKFDDFMSSHFDMITKTKHTKYKVSMFIKM